MLERAEMSELTEKIAFQLHNTVYACSSLSLLSGDTTNIVFRGQLSSPLAGGRRTIVIKYHQGYLPSNHNFKIDISRSMVEVAMLRELESLSPVREGRATTRTPCVYYSGGPSDIHILEDLSGTTDLKTMLTSSNGGNLMNPWDLQLVGRMLGSWLRTFHSWTSDAARSTSGRKTGENRPMRDIRYRISYGAFIDIVGKFPALWTQYGLELADVRNMADAEYARTTDDSAEGNWGIIHGDFWAGNILWRKDELPTKQDQADISLFVIDWEFTQFGRREYDIGQLLGDLLERAHFNHAESAHTILEQFIAGYGPLSHEMAFRIAIHAGVHVICWYIRRNSTAPFAEPLEQIQEIVRIGTELVVYGWRKEKKSLASGALACLFH